MLHTSLVVDFISNDDIQTEQSLKASNGNKAPITRFFLRSLSRLSWFHEI